MLLKVVSKPLKFASINMIAILIILAIMGTLGLLKLRVF